MLQVPTSSVAIEILEEGAHDGKTPSSANRPKWMIKLDMEIWSLMGGEKKYMFWIQ